MDTGSPPLRIWLIRAGFGLWALAIALLIGLGTTLFALSIDKWIEDGFDFIGWSIFDWLAGLIGAGMIHAGLLLAGLFFRFFAWSHADAAALSWQRFPPPMSFWPSPCSIHRFAATMASNIT